MKSDHHNYILIVTQFVFVVCSTFSFSLTQHLKILQIDSNGKYHSLNILQIRSSNNKLGYFVSLWYFIIGDRSAIVIFMWLIGIFRLHQRHFRSCTTSPTVSSYNFCRWYFKSWAVMTSFTIFTIVIYSHIIVWMFFLSSIISSISSYNLSENTWNHTLSVSPF